MSAVAPPVGKFVWHEQVSSDPKQAQDFYTQLFGWGTETFKPGEMDYTMISAGGQSHGGFGKAMEGAPPPHWLSHVQVENVEETVEQAKSAGGSLTAGPFEMGEVGRMAIIADPTGAHVSVYPPRAFSSGTSSARTTSTPPSASTRTCSAGRPPTWAPTTAATGSSTAARRGSPG
jgi:uncharacterized protein